MLAFADEHGEEFYGRSTAEELNRLDGMFEGAQMVVSLEEWGVSRERASESQPGCGSGGGEGVFDQDLGGTPARRDGDAHAEAFG